MASRMNKVLSHVATEPHPIALKAESVSNAMVSAPPDPLCKLNRERCLKAYLCRSLFC
jgi:hypothetical protein